MVGKIIEEIMAAIFPKLVKSVNPQISVKPKHKKLEENSTSPIIIQLLKTINKKILKTGIEEMTHCDHRKENKYDISWDKKILARASLVAQWLRIRLPMQGTRVRALVWEDPTCHGANRPVSHNY